MKTIFVVIDHEIESDTILGIFTSREKAEAMKNGAGEVEEWPVDVESENWIRWTANLIGKNKREATWNYVHEMPNAHTLPVPDGMVIPAYISIYWFNITTYAATAEAAKGMALAELDRLIVTGKVSA